MAWKMNVSARYGTHLAALIKAVRRTDGDILELGMGVFSTPFLHYIAILDNRKLVSVENDKGWAKFFFEYGYEHPNHQILVVDNYAGAPIDKFWDVVLVDQTPDLDRKVSVKRLANLAKYIIIHDSNENMDHTYHYSEIYPLFKYKKVWDKDSNYATVLSNFVELEDLWE